MATIESVCKFQEEISETISECINIMENDDNSTNTILNEESISEFQEDLNEIIIEYIEMCLENVQDNNNYGRILHYVIIYYGRMKQVYENYLSDSDNDNNNNNNGGVISLLTLVLKYYNRMKAVYDCQPDDEDNDDDDSD